MASSRLITATTLCALVLSACSGADDIASESDETTDPEPAATSTTSVTPADTESTPSSTATESADSPEPDTSPDASTTTSTTTPPPPPLVLPTQTLIAVDDNDVAEPIEVAVGAPASFEELIEVGIEAGYWDEIGGIERVLGYALGVVDASQVPGIDTVSETDISGVLGHANELALSDEYSADELALIEQRYEWFAPSAEALDQAAAGTPNGLRGIHGFSAPAAASGGCANLDPDMMDSDAYIADCYDVVTSSIPGADIRVFTPSWFADDATAANIAPTALAAIEHSLETYRDLGEIGDVDMMFSDSAMTESDGVHASATVTRQWDTVTVAGCPVTMFGSSWGGGPTALEQTIAHEIWHCVQHYDGFPMHVPGGTAWYREGGATYFSNVAYPSHDHEIDRLSRFDYRSLSTPLHELSYETWVWWQYVGNAYGPLYVADLHREMMNAGGNGASLISDLEDMFHDFVVHLAAAKVRDQDGKFLPKARYYMSLDTVTEGQENRKIEMKTGPFTAARWHIYYDKELRVLQTDTTGTDGTLSMVEAPDRYVVENWEQVFPEVRSKCDDRAHYAMIAF